MKRCFTVMLSILFLFTFFSIVAFAELEFPEATNLFTNDFANVFSDETRKAIALRADELLTSYEDMYPQIMVVTVESCNGEPTDSFARQMFLKYGIGKQENNIGALILFVLDEKLSCIITDKAIEKYINSEDISRINSLGISYFEKDNFDAGLNAIQENLVNHYKMKLGKETPAPVSTTEQQVDARLTDKDKEISVLKNENLSLRQDKKRYTLFFIFIITILTGACIFLFVLATKEKGRYSELRYQMIKVEGENSKQSFEIRNLNQELGEKEREIIILKDDLAKYSARKEWKSFLLKVN